MSGPQQDLSRITEDDEDGDSEEPAGGDLMSEQVPQCFSHFSHDVTHGRKLVCDLQGVWNATDGFMLTDPVIHDSSGSRRYGATSKGDRGIAAFFSTHTCNALCQRLGLTDQRRGR